MLNKDEKQIINYSPVFDNYLAPDADFFGVVDSNLCYQCLSLDMIKMLGFNNCDDAIGASDYDMKCPGVVLAEKFRSEDKEVLQTNKPVVTLNIISYCNELSIIFSVKTPFLSTHIVCNVWSVPPSKYNILGLNYISHAYACSAKNVNKCFIIKETFNLLSMRESEVLFHLLRRRSASNCAHFMGLSHRTVESYIEVIKNKMDCNAISQVIEKSICSGYVDIIPASVAGISIPTNEANSLWSFRLYHA